jgi:hypothetical protein
MGVMVGLVAGKVLDKKISRMDQAKIKAVGVIRRPGCAVGFIV